MDDMSKAFFKDIADMGTRLSFLNWEEKRQEDKLKDCLTKQITVLKIGSEVKDIKSEVRDKAEFLTRDSTQSKFEELSKFEDMFPNLEKKHLTRNCLKKLEKISYVQEFDNEIGIQNYCSTIIRILELDDDLSGEHIAVNAQSNTSSKQSRKADILFHEYEPSNFNASGHTGWCAQRNALFPIELKSNFKNGNNINCSFTKQ